MDGEAMKVIEVDDLAFYIGGKPILDGVSFEVEAGDYVSVIGPNGAGKSTLLKCLVRIHTGWSGSVRIKCRPMGRYTRRQLARLVSYVPQTMELIQPFTVREFVLMGRYPYLSPFSSTNRDDEDAVDSALDMIGMEGFAGRNMSTLSGGERQKVLIAGAMAQGAEIVLLDEPTTFLDPRHQHEIINILRRINTERGTTVVSVTHDVNNAALFSRGIIALKNGAVVFNGPPERIMNNDTLMDIYEKPFTFIPHPRTGTPMIVPEAE